MKRNLNEHQQNLRKSIIILGEQSKILIEKTAKKKHYKNSMRK